MVHPLSWLLSNNRLEEVCSTLTNGTFFSRLLLSNQVKGCSPSVAHSLPLPVGPALLNLSIIIMLYDIGGYRENVNMNIIKAWDQGQQTCKIKYFSLLDLLIGFWIMLIRKQNLHDHRFQKLCFICLFVCGTLNPRQYK